MNKIKFTVYFLVLSLSPILPVNVESNPGVRDTGTGNNINVHQNVVSLILGAWETLKNSGLINIICRFGNPDPERTNSRACSNLIENGIKNIAVQNLKDIPLANLMEIRIKIKENCLPPYKEFSEEKREILLNHLNILETEIGIKQVNCAFLDAAKESKSAISIRPINPSAFPLIAQGKGTKGLNIKSKSCVIDECKGYIPFDQRYAKGGEKTMLDNIEMGEEIIKKSDGKVQKKPLELPDGSKLMIGENGDLKKCPFECPGLKPFLILADENGDPITADADLFAIEPAKGDKTKNETKFEDNLGDISEHEKNIKEFTNKAFCKHSGLSEEKCKPIVHHGPENKYGANYTKDREDTEHPEKVFPINFYSPSGHIEMAGNEGQLQGLMEKYNMEKHRDWDWNNKDLIKAPEINGIINYHDSFCH